MKNKKKKYQPNFRDLQFKKLNKNLKTYKMIWTRKLNKSSKSIASRWKPVFKL